MLLLTININYICFANNSNNFKKTSTINNIKISCYFHKCFTCCKLHVISVFRYKLTQGGVDIYPFKLLRLRTNDRILHQSTEQNNTATYVHSRKRPQDESCGKYCISTLAINSLSTGCNSWDMKHTKLLIIIIIIIIIII